MQRFKEGNVCWNCIYINTCRPALRPVFECSNYAALGEPISHKRIGELLGVGLSSINSDIQIYGAEKIVNDMLKHGYKVRFDTVGDYVRFYLLP